MEHPKFHEANIIINLNQNCKIFKFSVSIISFLCGLLIIYIFYILLNVVYIYNIRTSTYTVIELLVRLFLT